MTARTNVSQMGGGEEGRFGMFWMRHEGKRRNQDTSQVLGGR